MITPRLTRLVRVPDLQGLHAFLAERAVAAEPLEGSRSAVLVPTRGAGEALRRTLESRLLARGPLTAVVLPAIVTRADLYVRLHEGLDPAPPMLTTFEREVLFRRAARLASERGAPAPFKLRAGLVIEILAFYDELRRRHRSVADFERLMTESLASSVEFDRGAERMMRQTRFLAAAFAEFERAVSATGCLDEHSLRARLIESAAPCGVRRLVVTVADQAADAHGLWTADYDLLARVPGLESLDVVATEQVLAAGYHERIHDLLPGIEEDRRAAAAALPVLVAPEIDPALTPVYWFTARDREEELADVAARVKTGESAGRIAVVFQRPLPYLYLAKHVFADAALPYQALDALPLAAEPFAAAVDILFAVMQTEATRSSLIELLASPHWQFPRAPGGTPLTRLEVRALDAFLQRARYLGGWDRLRAIGADAPASLDRLRTRAGAALPVAVSVADRLRDALEAPSASAQFARLLAFIRECERRPEPSDDWHDAHLRARSAILGALQSLADAHRRHDDAPLEAGELTGTVRRWIEGRTFAPRTGWSGVSLLDAPAAAYSDADEVRLVGLVESDWPDRQGRSIFYPASLLSQLGWPADKDRLAAARARFRDLLTLARARVSLSTFTLEDDAIVPPSPFLEEVSACGLPVERRAPPARPRVFVHEALAEAPVLANAVVGPAREWLDLRTSRAGEGDRFRGFTGQYAPAAHAVSHVERYLECPFKYFATCVLRLEEERPDESGLTPQERGQLLHEVFERFFRAWHERGRRAISGTNLADALALFEEIAEARLSSLSESDRALERTYLLGSAVAPGLAERAFAFEIEHGVEVLERLLEHALEGEFVFEAGGERRRLVVRAKADRIDLLGDGTLRVIDYKLGRAPRPARALQLPIYGVCAVQHLRGRHGRDWQVSRAGYVAFRERNAFVPLSSSSSLEEALADGQQRFLTAVAAIERGEFPVDPDEPFLCSRCGYAAVCRKDYVGDE